LREQIGQKVTKKFGREMEGGRRCDTVNSPNTGNGAELVPD
jgi:hypothetical protein